MGDAAERHDREALAVWDPPEHRRSQQTEWERSQQHEHAAVEDPSRIRALEPAEGELEGFMRV
jgi:hypothetical protein